MVAVEGARFGLTETRLGLIPATISPYVLARLGEGRARSVFFSARVFDCAEAEAMGLVGRRVAPEDLDAAVEAEVAPYLAAAPGAVAAAKRLARSLGPRIDAEVIEATIARLADTWETPEAAEGIAAFLEKRPAAWVRSFLEASDRPEQEAEQGAAGQDGGHPELQRKTAMSASAASAAGIQSMVPRTGSSSESGPASRRTVAAKTVWMANQMARLRMTPTTAAVTAVRAAPRARLPRRPSMKGAPRKIQAKQGAKVTQVARRPPRVPARSGELPAGLAEGGEEADELQHHDQRARGRLGHAEAVEHLAGLRASRRSRPPPARHRRGRRRRRRR